MLILQILRKTPLYILCYMTGKCGKHIYD